MGIVRVTAMARLFILTLWACCFVQPAAALYLLPEPPPERVEAAISDTYRSCMGETGGYADIAQSCQAAEMEALTARLNGIIADICRREAEPLSGVGTEDALALGNCHLRQLARLIISVDRREE